ncbi:MAG: inositol monophosphatase [Bacteroidales bacterium]|jgi:myo-inositol-1(or 4)-monophosphatase|nr:inositol monophosphatase [Bacteroidales bacterium]
MSTFEKVIELVHETKKIILNPELRSEIYQKGASDFVTAVDTTVSSFMQTELEKLFPEIGFMSEEGNNQHFKGNRWILDPIDGTTNLIFDYQLSSVSLGLLYNGEIVFGIVYNPFTDETFYAEKGKGAYLNNKRLTVSERDISDSLIEFGAGSTRKNEADLTFQIAKEIFMDCIDIRRICSSALAISYIAAKRIDGYFQKVLKPWDYAAALLILEEAGGSISDWKGAKMQFEKPSSIIASNKRIHNYLLSKMPQL